VLVQGHSANPRLQCSLLVPKIKEKFSRSGWLNRKRSAADIVDVGHNRTVGAKLLTDFISFRPVFPTPSQAPKYGYTSCRIKEKDIMRVCHI
jgi:hypothetical protein